MRGVAGGVPSESRFKQHSPRYGLILVRGCLWQKNPVTDSATQGTRRQAAHPFQRSIQCKPLRCPRNSFFLFFAGAPWFLFTVIE